MKSSFGIVFLHHQIDPVVLNNLRSIRRHNSGATLATISSGEPLPDGYTLDATPELKQLHAAAPKRSSDRLVCSWFLQRKEQCRKWWIVEWDTYCTTSARNYYQPVWEFPFVAAQVCLRYRQPEWHWFQGIKDLPAGYRPFATGAVPFLYLLSEEALRATCALLLEQPLTAGNGELRFATAATRAGFPPCGYSPPGDRITWINWPALPAAPAIFHPVKHLVPF